MPLISYPYIQSLVSALVFDHMFYRVEVFVATGVAGAQFIDFGIADARRAAGDTGKCFDDAVGVGEMGSGD